MIDKLLTVAGKPQEGKKLGELFTNTIKRFNRDLHVTTKVAR
jgi:hypothetical protein